MDLSIVIPVYNEEKRLASNLAQIFSYVESLRSKLEIELIFVSDGSKDGTLAMLKEFQKNHEFKIVDYADNHGKGYAVRRGVGEATGSWVVFFDIDLATPLQELEHFLAVRQPEDRIIIGSRRLKGSEIKKSESALRVFLGQGFTKLSNLLVPGIADFTCGFKCFSLPAAKKIFSLARINRWGFDTEILYIAKLHGIDIRQIPVSWSHDDDTRVKVAGAVLSSLKELVSMKVNQLQGRYD